MLNNKKQRGITLIEVLVVTSIFAIGFSAMLTSAVAFFTQTVFSGDYLIASNLAREAVEAVRKKRDENFLSQTSAWDDGLTFSSALVKPQFNGVQFLGSFILEPVTYTLDECIAGTAPDQNCIMYKDATTGLYVDPGAADILGGGERTKFYRMVSLAPTYCDTNLSAQGLCTYSIDPAFNEKIGVEVSAEVRWFQGSTPRTVVVSTTLYNWF